MSGIAGIVRFDEGPVAHNLIDAMTEALAHRGPDERRHWASDSIALGHAMFRTTSESLEEIQPATNEQESVVLTMDGRIDNWQDLRRDLLAASAKLRNRSDAELVLRAYECWGEECLNHLEGDFALALWDARTRKLVCARDHVGARPFYYFCDDRSFVFASELHAVLQVPWVPEVFNDGLAAEFLGNDLISREETFWHGVNRLVAAHRIVIENGRIRTGTYWTPEFEKEIRYRRTEEYADHYRSLLEDIVQRQSRAHLPIACEVSGGIDSSSIFAIAETLRRSGQLLAPAIEANTVRFEPGTEADEIEFARAVAALLDRPIREVEPCFAPLEWFKAWAGRYRDFSHYPNTILPHALFKGAAARGIRTILTGYGGDEWQMGTRFYYADCLETFDLVGLASNIRADSAAYGFKEACYWLLRFGLFPQLPQKAQDALKQFSKRMRGQSHDVAEWLTPDMKTLLDERRQNRPERAFKPKRMRHESSIATLVSASRAHTRESFDALAASVGIERRDPLASLPIVRFHFATPENIRLMGNQYRLCHRTAMRGLVPDHVLDRTTKARFSVAFRHHLARLEQGSRFELRDAAPDWVNGAAASEYLTSAADDISRSRLLWPIWALIGCHLVRKTLKL